MNIDAELHSAELKATAQVAGEIAAQRDLLREALEQCLRFMHTEMGWEYFRAEMLHHGNPDARSMSERNAEKLRLYLCDMAAKYPELAEIVKRTSV